MKTSLFTYTNYRGDKGGRRVHPISIIEAGDDLAKWGYRPGQWLLFAYDYDKHDVRSFAMSKIERWCEADQSDGERQQLAAWMIRAKRIEHG